MTSPNEKSDSELSVQEHCIDLPGESVQCWVGGGTKKLKVILRKHRDIIFDIHIGNGKTYTLETTDSDFYNVRDKKLIYAVQHGKITFKDGERMHVWVSRGFRGALMLKCEGHLVSEVKPNEWDTSRHSDDPKEKPAPIIIAIANSPSAKLTSPSAKMPTPSISTLNSKALDNSEPSIHVLEVSIQGAPTAVLEFFQNGGESLQLDSQNIITRNWITAQLAGSVGYILDNHTWINELKGCKFRLETVRHNSNSKIYMIFTGNNRIREVMSGSRYSMQHTKIMRITGGAGGAKQGWDAAKGAAKDSFKVIAKEEGKMVIKGGGIALVITIGMDFAEWYKDYSEIGLDGKPKKDVYALFSKLGVDLVKTGLVAALSTITVAGIFCLVGALAGATLALPVVLIVVGTIAVSIGWGLLLDYADKKIGNALKEEDTATWLAKKFREIAQHLSTVSKDVRYDDYPAIPI